MKVLTMKVLSMKVSGPMDWSRQSKGWKQVCKVLFKPSTFCRFRSWIISRLWSSTFVSPESRTYNSKPSNFILWFYSFWKCQKREDQTSLFRNFWKIIIFCRKKTPTFLKIGNFPISKNIDFPENREFQKFRYTCHSRI